MDGSEAVFQVVKLHAIGIIYLAIINLNTNNVFYYMYDFTYKLTYNESDDDDVYRKELLDVFFLKEYNGDKINDTVNNLIKPLIQPHFEGVFKIMNERNELPIPLDEYTCIILLLAWENFYLFHRCLGEIKTNKITDSITTLISELKKT